MLSVDFLWFYWILFHILPVNKITFAPSMISTYHDLRQFYNQVVHPELLNMERRRRRLVRLMTASMVLLVVATALAAYINTMVFTLLLLLPLGFWAAYIGFRIQVFFLEFKPN